MREGFYSLTYAGATGDFGFGMIVLDTGADVGGGIYNGTYVYNTKTELLDVELALTIPPGVPLVTGVPPQEKEYTFPISASFPRQTQETAIRVETPFGPVNTILRFVREFPD